MRLAKITLVLAAGFLLVGTAAAQQQQRGQQPGGFGGFGGFGGGFGGGGLSGMLTQSKQLQDELKISKEQIDKITDALAEVREQLKDDLAKLRNRDTQMEERAEITKKLNEANTKALNTVLEPAQLKRFQQIENQQAGVGMYVKASVQKALKLSEDQIEKIDTINKDYQKDLRDLFGGGQGGQGGRGRPDPNATEKRQGLQKETTEAIQRILTEDQRVALKDLTGEPFELRREGFGAGGFGGGTGGFGGGFGGFGGRPSQPGQVLSANMQETLKLTAEQKKELEEFQKEVDSKLSKLLTEDQQKQLKEIQDNARRGGFGGGAPGGRPGQGRPGNPPRQ